MNVYVVIAQNNSDKLEILGVFTSEEIAQTVRRQFLADSVGWDVCVEVLMQDHIYEW